MKKNIIGFCAFLLILTNNYLAFSHHPGPCSITGKVLNQKDEPLVGASVYWVGTTNGVSTGSNGEFTISTHDIEDLKLVASFVGHVSDTINIEGQEKVFFVLIDESLLGEVVVRGQRSGVVLSSITAIATETITSAELQKSACCDLAGCFETQTSVQPQTTNIVTNAKELRIMGLSGVYNQILIDGLPMIQGLSQTYGISNIPGTLVQNIHVTKGTNSVLQGPESISGQIAVETSDPWQADKLLLNAFVNSDMEKQFNAQFSFLGTEVGNILALHSVQPSNRIDKNGDAFLDLPLLTRYSLFNKTTVGHGEVGEIFTQVAFRLLSEKRTGGLLTFDPSLHKGSNTVYGQSVSYNQYDLTTRTGFRVSEKLKYMLFASAFYQNQNSYFGTVGYNAKQLNIYANLQQELHYGQGNHLNAGASLKLHDLDEAISFAPPNNVRTYDGEYENREVVAGVFAENTLFLVDNKVALLSGLRVDWHNQFGFKLTPRALIKVDITPKTIVRANIGTGWRTVNLFSENITLLASSRNIIFVEDLEPESAANFGINVLQKFEMPRHSMDGYVSVDLYRTNFSNQFFPDYDTDPTLAVIGNFKGESSSLGLQVEASLSLFGQFELKTGYNYLDVYRVHNGVKKSLPFISTNRLLQTIGFSPLSGKFRADLNMHWYGKQRLPSTASNPVEFQRPDYSDPYTLVNFQFTYKIKGVEIYSGVENLLGFRQDQPIISWQDPFGPYFDTALAWGPTRGREFYLGVRWRIN